jgi:hypothetical protein
MNFSQNMVSDLQKAWVIDATCLLFCKYVGHFRGFDLQC